MKSVVSLLAMAPDRASAANWASELEKNGFAHHSAEEVKKALSVRFAPTTHDLLLTESKESLGPTPALADADSFGTPSSSEPFPGHTHPLAGSSYGGSSREEREQSQSSLAYSHDNPVDVTVAANPSPLSLEAAANALNKFGFDCAFYRRTKRDQLANGWSEPQIFGRSEIDVDTLLLGFLDPQDAQPVSTWCSRTVNRLLPSSPLPVRLASTWLLTKLMRVSNVSHGAKSELILLQFLIWPSVENVNASPEWLMPPAGKQETSPYDMLIDLVPWYVRRLFKSSDSY